MWLKALKIQWNWTLCWVFFPKLKINCHGDVNQSKRFSRIVVAHHTCLPARVVLSLSNSVHHIYCILCGCLPADLCLHFALWYHRHANEQLLIQKFVPFSLLLPWELFILCFFSALLQMGPKEVVPSQIKNCHAEPLHNHNTTNDRLLVCVAVLHYWSPTWRMNQWVCWSRGGVGGLWVVTCWLNPTLSPFLYS